MTANPHTVGQTQPLAAAWAMMREHSIRHLPVLHGGELVGVLTANELRVVEALPGVDSDVVKVEEALSGDTYAVAPETPVGEVVSHMAKHKISSAIIVAHEKVQGVFTIDDALRLLSDALSA